MTDKTRSGTRVGRFSHACLFIARILIVCGMLGLLGVVGFVFWFRISALAALPRLDGVVVVTGLTAPVTVIRDNTGTPHIRAVNLDDLFMAQGYIAAQDRLFQMDLSRRIAAGELSEIMGPPLVRGESAARLLERDRQQRYLQIRRAAEWTAAQAGSEDRRFFAAYARGVNAYIEQNRSRLPIEFRFLGYQPRPWAPVDSVLVGTNISQMMNSQFPVEWRRDRFAARLSAGMLDDLYVNDSPRDRAPGEGWGVTVETAHAMPKAARGIVRSEPDAPASPLWEVLRIRSVDVAGGDPGEIDLRPGSNNWAVSGRYTASGRPMLSNDMHLPH
ncbi:MAG: penicillin acylase family protein, partial [Acidobacteria bacterium]|nr:penicillin acylase family protein [Acidobacteriota bacterium]